MDPAMYLPSGCVRIARNATSMSHYYSRYSYDGWRVMAGTESGQGCTRGSVHSFSTARDRNVANYPDSDCQAGIQWVVGQFMVSQRILIVEDEDVLLRNFEIFLTELGHSIHCAASGKDAVRLIGLERFDIVITDIGLGDMDGFDLVRLIMSRSPLTSVLVITADSSVDSVIEALRMGVHDYLLKPFSLEALGQMVESAARQR